MIPEIQIPFIAPVLADTGVVLGRESTFGGNLLMCEDDGDDASIINWKKQYRDLMKY